MTADNQGAQARVPVEPDRPWVVLPLRTWLVLSHLVVLVLPLVVLLGTRALAYDLRAQTRDTLQHQGVLLALLVAEEVSHARELCAGCTAPNETIGIANVAPTLNVALKHTKENTLAGIRVVDAKGIVQASSADHGVVHEDLSHDPEVIDALSGQLGVSVRPRAAVSSNQPLGSKSRRAKVRLFVAVPIEREGEMLGAVVLSRTPREEMQALYQMAPRLSWGLLGALLFTLGLAIFYGYLFSRSLHALAAASHRIAGDPSGALGDLVRPRESHVLDVAHVGDAVSIMAGRLQERLRYISDFAGNVSHEFKTPLATLKGTIELLQDDDAMPPEQRARFLANAASEVARLDRLVGGLLALARAEEGQERQEVDLQEVIDEVLARHGVECEGSAGRVLGDRAQLATVLDNLISNARRYGGDEATVRVGAFTEGRTTGFIVSDDGPGISEANVPKVFDRFFTTDREGGGTGLGLALVAAVCRSHGGEVAVESEVGRTVFRVGLPRR